MDTTTAGRTVRAAGGVAVTAAALALAWGTPSAAAAAVGNDALPLHGESASPTPAPDTGHDHGAEPEEPSGHDHGAEPEEPAGHDHGAEPEDSGGHSHGGEPDTVSTTTKTVVVGGFGLVNAAVVGTAFVIRRRERRDGGPARGPRNVRAAASRTPRDEPR
ncbi:hypothetical protein [Nocardioides ferulae]|uniref:hypothetical protein n=1 Tax=Nocardioides ferulae TaxID=2340821 RepID=UPI000F86AE7A|nr:hypothetical protein [Nocardioides ferulae]